MLSDIVAFGFFVIGIISVLFFITFKLIIWRMEDLNIVIPLIGQDKTIYDRIYNIRSFLDFCGIKDKYIITIEAENAPEWVLNDIKEYYKNYDFLVIKQI